ncbi:protein of unknown function [Hyphomicrobium sp. MC1]|nr:protein of unknown function [Hyphomicrobium sp. MC1]
MPHAVTNGEPTYATAMKASRAAMTANGFIVFQYQTNVRSLRTPQAIPPGIGPPQTADSGIFRVVRELFMRVRRSFELGFVTKASSASAFVRPQA